jgi:hypothetical protein
MSFYHTVDLQRLNKRFGVTLKGRTLKKVKKIVETHPSISTSGECGSIDIDNKDFIELESR